MIRTSILSITALAGSALAQVPPTFAPSIGRVVPGSRANGKLELGDVTGDGKLDAVLTDLIDRAVRVMPQLPGTSFADPIFTNFGDAEVPFQPGFTLGDLNEDGRSDIAIGLLRAPSPAANTPNIATLEGQPDGAFANRLNYNNQPGIDFPNQPHDRGLLLVDLNHDGNLDLLSSSNNDFINNPGCRIVAMLGDGQGNLGPPIQSGAGHCQGTEFMLAGDINGDTHLDVISAYNSGSNSHARTNFHVNFGDGTGSFTSITNFTLDMQLPTGSGNPRIYLRDANGDGKADLFAFGRNGSQSGAGGLYVMTSDGDGTFTSTFRLGYFGTNTPTIGVEDLNGDNRPDIIMPGPYGAAGIVRVNNGAAGFDTTVPFPALAPGYEARDIATGILDSAPLPSVVIMTVYDFDAQMRLFTVLNTTPQSGGCYANCDASTGSPPLTANDFLCFINKFASGDSYANCDGSSAEPLLTANDFVCFVNRYAQGCS